MLTLVPKSRKCLDLEFRESPILTLFLFQRKVFARFILTIVADDILRPCTSANTFQLYSWPKPQTFFLMLGAVLTYLQPFGLFYNCFYWHCIKFSQLIITKTKSINLKAFRIFLSLFMAPNKQPNVLRPYCKQYTVCRLTKEVPKES